MLTTMWEVLAGSIVFGWVLSRLWLIGRAPLLCYGAGLVLIAGTALAGLSFGGVFVATFEPFGVMLPLLCLANTANRAGLLNSPEVPRLDKLVLAALMLAVLLGAGGALPWHPYSWFYTGLGPALLAGVLGIWALARWQVHIMGIVALAQTLWLLDIGSSNLYDQVAHTVLIPALVISALWIWPRKSPE